MHIIFKSDTINEIQLIDFLNICSSTFIPKLQEYTDINTYCKKLITKAYFIEAHYKEELVGLIAYYKNDEFDFISHFSVHPNFFRKNIGNKLLDKLKKNNRTIILEVFKINYKAINFYFKNEFIILNKSKTKLKLMYKNNRNYDHELKDTKDHKYAYNFDFDVMHPFMIKSFKPFYNKGNILELGSFKGDFTKHLALDFDNITCIEASKEAIEDSKVKLKDSQANISYINDLFEKANLLEKFDNIVITHVLEHIDDPIFVLKKIRNEWLKKNGRLFIVCPNANAASRQIAVKMGLLPNNSCITDSEKAHGHRITYSLDTLERDVTKAGLTPIHRSGIFFKALANFQWDKILNTDIISKEYLEGCFKLGQIYPDLCSSVFIVCEK